MNDEVNTMFDITILGFSLTRRAALPFLLAFLGTLFFGLGFGVAPLNVPMAMLMGFSVCSLGAALGGIAIGISFGIFLLEQLTLFAVISNVKNGNPNAADKAGLFMANYGIKLIALAATATAFSIFLSATFSGVASFTVPSVGVMSAIGFSAFVGGMMLVAVLGVFIITAVVQASIHFHRHLKQTASVNQFEFRGPGEGNAWGYHAEDIDKAFDATKSFFDNLGTDRVDRTANSGSLEEHTVLDTSTSSKVEVSSAGTESGEDSLVPVWSVN